jgi:hypothetical protein
MIQKSGAKRASDVDDSRRRQTCRFEYFMFIDKSKSVRLDCRLGEINFVDLLGLDREGQQGSRVTGEAAGRGSKGRKERSVVVGG